jgi:hypothetical protein
MKSESIQKFSSFGEFLNNFLICIYESQTITGVASDI